MVEILYISILTVFASAVGTMTGFGTSTIMVPVMLMFYSLPQTLLIVGIIHWFGNIWKIVFFRKGLNKRFVILFGIPGILATYIGARLVFEFPEEWLIRILGIFLISYVMLIFFKPTFRLPKKDLTAMTGGGLYGLSAGIFGVGGAIRGVFLSAFNLPKEVYIATAGAIGLIIDSVRVTTYLIGGSMLTPNLTLGLVFFIPASLFGAYMAKRIVNRIPQKSFRLVVGIFLLFSAIMLLVGY